MNKIRVGIVSYLNTKPLIYGLEKEPINEMIELIGAYPAKLAQMLADAARANGWTVEEAGRWLVEFAAPTDAAQLASAREICDHVEESVADEFWTLPKYREMLSLI